MRFTRLEIAAAVDGVLTGSDGLVDGVSIDSRSLRNGMLFVPVVADRDGHQFIGSVAGRAGAWLTMHPDGAEGEIAVLDTTVALQRLGSYARTRIGDRVIGVTGSVGKTTTRELIHAALASEFAGVRSRKNFNNTIGLPLTLLDIEHHHEFAVVEMGATREGDIAELAEIASPEVGVVTALIGAPFFVFLVRYRKMSEF